MGRVEVALASLAAFLTTATAEAAHALQYEQSLRWCGVHDFIAARLLGEQIFPSNEIGNQATNDFIFQNVERRLGWLLQTADRGL